jgi:hypothetical protein
MEYPQHPQDSIERPVAEDIIAPSSPLPNNIEKNIDTITVLKTKAEQDVAHPQRVIEKIADLFGHPTFSSAFLLFLGSGLSLIFCLVVGIFHISIHLLINMFGLGVILLWKFGREKPQIDASN